MRNRQHIQKLVLDGRIGEAISTTQQLYPGLLRNNQDLLFRLKVGPQGAFAGYLIFRLKVGPQGVFARGLMFRLKVGP